MANIEEIHSEIERCCDLVRSSVARTIVCSIPPVGGAKERVVLLESCEGIKTYLSASQDRQIAFFDWYAVTADEQGNLRKGLDSGDGEHMRIEGYREIGEGLADILLQLL